MRVPFVYFLFLALFLTTAGLSAQGPAAESPVLKVVDQMPLYPGCDDIDNYDARKECADRAMLTSVYSTVRYPAKARQAGVSGMAVVGFVVEKDGRITNPTVERNPGESLGDAALAVVQSWINTDLRWEPGYDNGEPQRVAFLLPVKFKLADEDAPSKTAEASPRAPQPDENGVYRTVQQMPLFPGCDETEGQSYRERKRCADRSMLEYVYGTVRYPEAAKDAEAEGMAVVSFIVEPDGRLSTPSIERDPGTGLGASALAVVNTMIAEDVRWTPGRVGDEAVRVRYLLPIKFKL